MEQSTKSLLPFSIGVFGTSVALGTLAVVGFDHYETALGRAGTLQTYVYFGLIAGIIAALGSGLGFALGGRRRLRMPLPVAVILSALLTGGLLYLGKIYQEHGVHFGLFEVTVAVLLGSFCVALIGIKVFGRRVHENG
jgi:Mn2+/Fe2+ NRAMP family transporter